MTTTDPRVKPRQGKIKCIVWDLDNTLWDGTLIEDRQVTVKPEVLAQIRRLDALGVLHSIASRNDHQLAMDRLREVGLADYFLYPQITWNPKSSSIQAIASRLNIGLDAIAFVDDQPFERAEVEHCLPPVTTVDTAHLATALRGPEFTPKFVTDESRQRRRMYRAAAERDQAEAEYAGTSEEFLATLHMCFTVAPAAGEDLKRAEELTVRTNQLNSTGRTYSYDQLDALRQSDDHLLLVASLSDRFGGYGTIGLALIQRGDTRWHLRLLLMSCRVMARGVGAVLLHQIMAMAKAAGADLVADLVHTGRNRLMEITYAMAGFTVLEHHTNQAGQRYDLLRHDLAEVPAAPGYLTLRVSDEIPAHHDQAPEVEAWLPYDPPTHEDATQPRLYCLPHSGGAASMFQPWQDQLTGITVRGLERPGHGTRWWDRSSLTRMDALLPGAAAAIRADGAHRPIALFGHSLGALICYELASLLPVQHLIVSGHLPPHRMPSMRRRVRDKTVPELVEHLRALGGVPEELLDTVLRTPDRAGLVLGPLLADEEIGDTYAWRPRPPLAIPITVIAATADPQADVGVMGEWQRYTSLPITIRHLDGGHFAITEQPGTVLGYLQAALRPHARGQAS